MASLGNVLVTTEADFIVTIHALERMEQRFRDLCSGLSDRVVGELIHGEVMDAIDAGRRAKMPPIELAPSGHERWLAQRKNGSVVWNEDKSRGYVLQDTDEGMFVLTVLVGDERALKQKLLRRSIR